MKNIAIIVGAGSGERFGSYKQIETINNKPVYKYSIDAFLDSECFSRIILAVPKKLLSIIHNQINEEKYKDIIVCEGGNTRAQSVYNAFSKISKNGKNKIFIHDAARPLISTQIILNLVHFSKKENAVVLAKKISETVKSVKEGQTKFTVDRSNLWTAETPQVFNQEILHDAYDRKLDSIDEYSDEASLVEECGYEVKICENRSLNTKITTKEDIDLISKNILKDYKDPVLVQSIDGVGTKTIVAKKLKKFDTIGIDLLSACANDILVMGAKPLTFLDYIASEKLNPSIIEEIVSGMVKGCRETNVALVGGETAEMPDTYLKNAAGKVRKSTKGRFSNGEKETVYNAHANGALPRDVIKISALAGGAGKKERVNHPTQKPLELCEKLIKASKNGNDTLLVVPFAGSGSECVAAKKLNINFIGYEINEEYVKLCNERLDMI